MKPDSRLNYFTALIIRQAEVVEFPKHSTLTANPAKQPTSVSSPGERERACGTGPMPDGLHLGVRPVAGRWSLVAGRWSLVAGRGHATNDGQCNFGKDERAPMPLRNGIGDYLPPGHHAPGSGERAHA
ncbi:MAG TPA: hypothetical protein VGC09_05820 [Rhodopila sp.]